MMNKLLVLIITLLVVSCTSTEKNENKNTQQIKEVEKAIKVGKKNFAVVWNWETKDKNLVDDNLLAQAEQFTNLWKEGIIENAYFNSQPSDQFENYPSISLVIKASSEENASAILDDCIFVKKGISNYTLHPIGIKWLDRKDEVINENGMSKTWVAVWSSTIDLNSEASKKELNDNVQKQSDDVLALWKAGKIENVYFDIEGTQSRNEVQDFVMHVNANSEQEAKAMMDELPFAKKNIAHYQLFPVGVYWMGVYQ